jgi:DegV family protein with EDD domain
VRIILTIDKLDYARMSGRGGTISAALASMLNVKPIAVLKNGLLDMVEKVRTRKAALKRVIEMAKEEYGDKPVHLGILHARDLPSGQELLAEARKLLKFKDTEMIELTIAIAANLGPGTVGLVLYPAD